MLYHCETHGISDVCDTAPNGQRICPECDLAVVPILQGPTADEPDWGQLEKTYGRDRRKQVEQDWKNSVHAH